VVGGASLRERGGSGRSARVLDVVDETLALAAARHRLGLETADSLRALAVALLAAGNEDALQLAIADDLDLDDLEPIFGKLCRDLGQARPTLEQARRTVTRAILQDIIDGTIAPEACLAHLVRGITPWKEEPPDAYVGDSWGLQHLVGLYWNYDDLRERPTASIDGKHGNDAIPLLDREVISRAREWLAGDALQAADPS
jgi:hypothetical protein